MTSSLIKIVIAKILDIVYNRENQGVFNGKNKRNYGSKNPSSNLDD